MRVILKANFICCSEIKTKENNVFYRASLLSGDDKVDIGFNPETMPIYYELNQLKRFEEVELECNISLYNGKMYIDPVMPDKQALPK